MVLVRSKHLAVAIAALLAVSWVDGFAGPISPSQKSQQLSGLSMAQNEHQNQESSGLIRTTAVGAMSFVAAAAFCLSPLNVPPAMALEDDVSAPVETTTVAAPKTYSIAKCDVSKKAPPCVSTSNVRQLDLYVPPWTFSTSADEALARLKGAIEGEPLNAIVSTGDSNSRHLFVDSKRSKLGTTAYRMEFVINEADGVITFRSSAPEDLTGPDFGLQRKRLSEIRERAGTFGVMGESLDSADTKSTGEKGYGPIGQLKSFYGLQSGGGFEDVLSE